MGLFDKYPYTNLHELNLDWIIKKLQEIESGESGSDDESDSSGNTAMSGLIQTQFPYTNLHELNLDWIISKIKTIEEGAEAAAPAVEAMEAAQAAQGAAEDAQNAAEDAAEDAQNIADSLSDTLDAQNESITVLSNQMSEFIADHAGLSTETELWSGAGAGSGYSFILSDSPDNYDYVDVYFKYKAIDGISDTEYVSAVQRFDADDFYNKPVVISIPYTNGLATYVTTTEISRTSADDAQYITYEIARSHRVSWDGVNSSNAVAEDVTAPGLNPSSDYTGGCITKITGVKDTQSDAEVIDARIGADGTVYPTLGDAIRSQVSSGFNLRHDIRSALLACFQNVAWIGNDGQTYYNALANALAGNVVSISAVYTQGGTVYTNDTLDSLKSDLVVTAHLDDSTTEIVPASSYTLSGSLTVGTSTITVSYSGKTATFTVTVSNRSIRVFVGKGASSSSIVDNANRALSEPVAFDNTSNITIQFTGYSATKMGFKNTTTDTSTLDTTAVSFIKIEDIGTNVTGDGWISDTYERAVATKSGSKWNYYNYAESTGYARLLFANAADASTAISETISGTVVIQGTEYQLVEADIADFE